jgi:hypothetical protein
MINKERLDSIRRVLPERLDLFICSASFEQRCVSVAEKVSARVERALVIRIQEGKNASEANFRSLKLIFKRKLFEIKASRESPTLTANAFSAEIMPEVEKAMSGNVLIDITTFTHEHLLILLGLLRAKSLLTKITMVYTSASEYSFNTNEENVWLSRGVRQARSVLGYPGQFAPSKRLHLMILAGFESERAQTLIELMEPARLSLGIGSINNSISPAHHSRNEHFFSRLKNFVEHKKTMNTEVDTFEFSCVDPLAARDAILAQTEKYREFNTVISPMNTKVSTVGAGLAALDCERIQVVYALPAEYNESGYSTPGDSVTLFDLLP